MKKIIISIAIIASALSVNAQGHKKNSTIVSSQRRAITLSVDQISYLNNYRMQRVRDIMQAYKDGGTIKSDAADLIFLVLEGRK